MVVNAMKPLREGGRTSVMGPVVNVAIRLRGIPQRSLDDD
jgi:hypothetical protein